MPHANAPTRQQSDFRKGVRKVESRHHSVSNTNPYYWKDVFHITGSVVPVVAIPSLVLTIWSAVIVVVYTQTKFFQGWLPNSTMLITLLGVVLGLLLVFRTNTAYDRYWEGRKLWGSVFVAVRNLARFIWVGVHAKGSARLSPQEFGQKLGAINLLMAFLTSTKYYLRQEQQSYLIEDVAPYIQHLAEYSSGQPSAELDTRVLPLEICNHLSAYVAMCRAKDHVDVNVQGLMNLQINSLVDTFTNFERVRGTPIPRAYSVHLRQVLLLYILSLPFQLVPSQGYVTIPVVLLASFTLLGIESIGGEIENPFGLDVNDLPIDQYCDSVHNELISLMKRSTKIDPDGWTEPASIHQWPEAYTHKSHRHSRTPSVTPSVKAAAAEAAVAAAPLNTSTIVEVDEIKTKGV